MKKLYQFIVLLIFGAYSGWSQNLILNPGFELGSNSGTNTTKFTNYTIQNGNDFITPTTMAGEPRSGTRAVKVNVTGTQPNAPEPWSMQLVSDPIATQNGANYTVRVYVKSLLNQAGNISLSTNANINSNQQYFASQAAVFNTWTLLSWSVVANSANTEFALNMGANVNDYIIDDFEVTGPPPVMTGPLVVGPANPSFELGMADGSGATSEFTNWNILNGNDNISPTTEPSEVRTGSRALKVISEVSPDAWRRQIRTASIATTIGTVYTVRVYAKKLVDAAGGIRLSTNAQLGNEQYLPNRSIGLDWTLLTWNVTANTTNTTFVLDMNGNANTYFIDDMEITTPAPAPVVCLVQNGGLENGTGDVFTNWNKFNGAAALLATTVAGEVRTGTRALKVVVPSTATQGFNVQLASDVLNLTVGVTYKFSVYAKRAAAGTSTIQLSTNEGSTQQFSPPYTPGLDWTLHTWEFVAAAANTRIVLNLGGSGEPTYFIDDVCLELVCNGAFAPPVSQQPIAAGKQKFLGNVWSAAQVVNSARYFNQVTPENAGKWGSVETSDQVFNWTDLDASRKFASDNGFPYRFHVLFWGAQQPTWLKPLTNEQKVVQIRQWLTAISTRYNQDSGPFKKPEYIEVFNEVLNDPPNNLDNRTPDYQFRANNTTDNASGDYLEALRSLNAELGTTPWAYDYVVNAFKLARQYFGCDSKLMINEYGVENDIRTMTVYRQIVDALKAENLIDEVGIQTHSFSTQIYGPNYNETGIANRNANLAARLDQLADAGLPIQVTELDIDGDVTINSAGDRVTTGTQAEKDAFQLAEFERIFPIYWNHPSVVGVTMWGYRTGHWRSNQAAYLMNLCSGAPRPAMDYLNTTIRASNPIPDTFSPSATCASLNLKGRIAKPAAPALDFTNPQLYMVISKPFASPVRQSVIGSIVGVAPLAADGTFTLPAVVDGTYTLNISDDADGSTSPYSFGVGLTYTGEGLVVDGVFTSDGTADGLLRVQINSNSIVLPSISGRAAAATYDNLAFTLGGASPLPVELVSFTGIRSTQGNMLTWETAAEKDFSHFELERNLAGNRFSKIAKITKSEIRKYEFLDPLFSSAYYRLRMVDLDGSSKYSNIVFVENATAAISTFPNPTINNKLTLEYSNSQAEILKVELTNATGKVIQTLDLKTKAGKNTMQINLPQQKGLYFLKVTDAKGRITLKKVMN